MNDNFVFLILSFGYMKLEPNEAKVMAFFGDYREHSTRQKILSWQAE